MILFKNSLFFFTVLFLSWQQETVGYETEFEFFDEILENIRIFLRHISIPHVDFDTNEQEFGRIAGTVDDFEVTGLDQFNIIELKVTGFPPGVRNMTIGFPDFLVRGKYNLNGKLFFPIGDQYIPVHGNGDMRIIFGKASAYTKIILGYKRGETILKELDFCFNITTMDVKLENLMDGGPLEDLLNEYLSLIGPTVYNYYKAILMGETKKLLIDAINKFLKETNLIPF